MAEHVGKQLGYYQLLRLLGRGGFASVYQGEHIHLKSLAAIKLLNTHLTEDLQENFLNEARILARLAHPGIVRLLDFGIDEGVPFLVMEYAPYGTLRQLHPRNIKLPLVMVTNYVNQIAEGLQYAHSHKLIHRDLKPDNVLIGQRGNLLLSDFGVALIAQTTASRNPEVNFAGTAAYMAPEQLRGQPQLASDQYALGVMAYEWLCGTRPFHGTVVELYNQHAVIQPPLLREHVSNLPVEAEQVVLRALSKDPHERFPDVRAFAVALEQASQTVQGQGGADIYVVRQTASSHRDTVNPDIQPRDNASTEPSTSNQPESFTLETPLLPSEPSTFTSSSAPPVTPQPPAPEIPHTEPSTSQAFRDISQAPVPPPEQFRPSMQLPTPPTVQLQGLSAPQLEDLPTQELPISSSTLVQPTSSTLVQEGQPDQEIAVTKPVRKKRTRRNVVLLCASLLLLVALIFCYNNLSIFSYAKQRSAGAATATSTTAPEPGGSTIAATATGTTGKPVTTSGSTPVSNRSSSTNNTGSSVNGHSTSTGALTPTAQVLPTAGSTSIARSAPTSVAAPTPTATSAPSAPTPTPTPAVQNCTSYGWSISAGTGSKTGSFTTSTNCGTVKATINSGLLSVTNLTIQACTTAGCGSAHLAVPGSTVTLLNNVAAGTSFYLKTTSVLSLGISISGTLSC